MYFKEVEGPYGKRVEPLIGKMIAHGLLAFFGVILLVSSFGTIDAGERGVKTRLGNVVGTVDPGLYFKIPFLEGVTKMSVRTQSVIYERENPLASASSDLQDVSIASVTNYHVDPTKVVDIYVQYRSLESFEESVIRPAVRDTVKATASQYTAADLVTKRADFAAKVAFTLNERLADTYVVVEQSNITDLQFSDSFSRAIEAKVTAVQEAEAAKNNLEKVKFEAQQTIETAKAQAESIRIQAQAINSQGGADYVELQKIEKWNGQGCTAYCGLETSTGLLLSK
ncbi:MAG: prohibitin family protein [Candidatus Paceibacterota bacterium]|jgi:regulator of protease activity HflC (stomatin/prohibitin superfamily)